MREKNNIKKKSWIGDWKSSCSALTLGQRENGVEMAGLGVLAV